MINKKGFNNTERLILSWLELDAKLPFSRFGKKIRKSQQQISYIVNSFIKKGVIQQFYTLIDYSKLNTLNFRVYFKVSYINEKKIDELIEFLVKEPHTSCISTLGGRYDLICTFFALNPSQFNKTLKSIITKFPEQLQNYVVLTTIVNREFGRKYLFRDPSLLKKPIFGGDREPYNLKETDMQILNEISDNARKSSIEIAKKINLTPKTVIERINNLKKQKIIRGFKPLINARDFGYEYAIIIIRYHNISSEIEFELISYLKEHSNITGVTKTLGEWDIEIKVETKDTQDLRKIEIELRKRFALLIQKIEMIPIYHTHKTNFFPAFLINKNTT